ncbi:efflux RND transporter permease subunit [Sulfurospirillum sp. 1612]|uniref:efflux RND transporter permease subunit n=1 Tax=Sulfurospirillum sp. 1612 TaxID=3094835 RepID=UPI002F93624B
MIFEYFYKRPYLLYSIIFGFFIMGIVGLATLPKNLFPDANPAKIVVITKVPGATAKVVASTVSKPIEEELSRLGEVSDVSSVNVANMSVVSVEFGYKKSLNNAAVEVANALNIAKAKIPSGLNPAIYEAGDFTLPVDVIALSPKNKSITLGEIRKIADSFIKPRLLSNEKIGNVEVFGGYESAINVEIDPFKAKKYGVDFATIAKVIAAQNKDIPVGFIKGNDSFYTVTIYGEKDNVLNLENLLIKPNVRLKDIATVKWGHQKRTSGYIGNGKQAIALAIQRAPGGSVLDVSKAARAQMAKLEVKYPNINFEISDTQRDLIEQANSNMLDALKDAVIYTLLVIMLFLGNFRAIIAAGLSIPMVFFSTIAVIWLMGGELNIVIYTAIILALGMLTDDAVVVLENIERHLVEGKENLQEAIKHGTKEVLSPVFAGTFATVAIMFPLMFVGGYPQKIFKPLIETLIIALIISYFLSITFIPLLSAWLYKNGTKKTKIENAFEWFYQHSVGKLVKPYEGIIKFSNNGWKIARRVILTMGVVMFLVFSMKNIMPTIGKDAMPPMDTGILKAQITFSANSTVDDAESKLTPFLKWLNKQPWNIRSSIAFGTEPGVLSLGSGNLPTEATITINAINRFDRKKTLWDLENSVRKQLSLIPGIKRNDVFDFGATPLSSIKATVDTRITAPTLDGMAPYSKKVAGALKQVRGLTSVSTSWGKDFTEYIIDVNRNKALRYGITPLNVAMQIPIKGEIVSFDANLESMNTQFVRLYLKDRFTKNLETLKLLPITTKFGNIPLSQIATIKKSLTYAKIERDKMQYALDVNGYRAKRPVTHLTDDTVTALKSVKSDAFTLTQTGTIATINDSFNRMFKAIGLGVVLLIISLIAIYRSIRMALIMILVLPLSLIGASWGMLLFDKPSCMPSLLGILLLFGIIIKNAVLLIDFYQANKAKGESPFQSAIDSVTVRFRPVMMTAFGTIAGMIPIALEQAVGLERLSPLADVAIGGLLIGTLLTLIYVPIYAYIFDNKKSKKE